MRFLAAADAVQTSVAAPLAGLKIVSRHQVMQHGHLPKNPRRPPERNTESLLSKTIILLPSAQPEH